MNRDNCNKLLKKKVYLAHGVSGFRGGEESSTEKPYYIMVGQEAERLMLTDTDFASFLFSLGPRQEESSTLSRSGFSSFSYFSLEKSSLARLEVYCLGDSKQSG